MTGLIRKATLFSACGLISAGVALASIPSPANSILPKCMNLVAMRDGGGTQIADAKGDFSITIRDIGNQPINNSTVRVIFTNCFDLAFCSTALNGALGTPNCPGLYVQATTNALGVASFRIVGGAPGVAGGAPGAGGGCAQVTATASDGSNVTVMGNLTVTAFDRDGASGLGANDLSLWVTDFFNRPPPPDPAVNYWGRSDYDCDAVGDLGPNDLSVWITDFFSYPQPPAPTTSCVTCLVP